MTTPSDPDLMQRVRTGDREAFALLVDRHKDALVGYLARVAGCPERAQDLAQESFLRLYEHRRRYRESGRLKPYLFSIATNLLRSEERRKRRWRALSPLLGLAPTNGHPADGHPDPASTEAERGGAAVLEGSVEPSAPARLLEDELRREVGRAIGELPMVYRIPVVLHELEGWTYAEIARSLGCREGTVKSRIHRGRRRLEERLADYWRPAGARPAETQTPEAGASGALEAGGAGR